MEIFSGYHTRTFQYFRFLILKGKIKTYFKIKRIFEGTQKKSTK